MTPPCILGFKCPYRKTNGEGETMCIHPYLIVEPIWVDSTTGRLCNPETVKESFPMPDNMEAYDCPLIEPDSDIEKVLMGWKE